MWNKNKNFGKYLFSVLVCLLLICCSIPVDRKDEKDYEFSNIEIILEYFPESETVKGHFIINSGFQLGDLVIEDPKNNTIMDFYSDDVKVHPNYLEFSTSRTSLRDFKKSYPKGKYTFSSWRATSSLSESNYNLSFGFTDPPEIINPPEKHILKKTRIC